MKRMLTIGLVLLPAVVIGAQSGSAARGSWQSVASDDRRVAGWQQHDPAKWDGKEGYPLYLTGQSFSNGTVRMRFMLVDGKDDRTAGLVFGHQPNGTYYYVRYNTKDGNVALWRMDGDKRAVVKHGEAHAQLPVKEVHELVLTVSGKKVRASVGALSVEHELDQPVSGGLGFWTKPDAQSRFALPVISDR